MKGKKLKLITEILAIIVVCLISFVGVYTQEYNKMENQVADYELEKDLSGYRELIFEVSSATEVLDEDGEVVGNTDDYTDERIESYSYEKTDTKVNADEDLTEENYKIAKSIIEERLSSLGVEDYNIALNYEDGTIYLQLPENDDTDHIVSNILEVAEFEIKDSEDDTTVYLTNDDIKAVSAVYNTTTSGTTVYLQIEFDKNGTSILKEISTGDYATADEEEESEEDDDTETTEDETSSNEENESDVEAEVEVSTEEETESDETEENEDETSTDEEEEDTQKEITLTIDSTDMITTSFDDPIENGIIDLSMNSASTDTDTISETLQSTSTIAVLLNSGKMPLTYTISTDTTVNTDISSKALQKAVFIVAIIVVIACIILIIKYKLKGLLAAIAYIGFIALDLLLIRYTNVSISIETLVAAVLVLAISYICIFRLLNVKETDSELKKQAYLKEFKKEIITLLPIFIIAIIFTFIEWTKITTFGMFLFWGILLSVVYNYIITQDMIE